MPKIIKVPPSSTEQIVTIPDPVVTGVLCLHCARNLAGANRVDARRPNCNRWNADRRNAAPNQFRAANAHA
jgi:hypothetical protein